VQSVMGGLSRATAREQIHAQGPVGDPDDGASRICHSGATVGLQTRVGRAVRATQEMSREGSAMRHREQVNRILQGTGSRRAGPTRDSLKRGWALANLAGTWEGHGCSAIRRLYVGLVSKTASRPGLGGTG
jgi:hypothetical protein